MLSGEIWNRSVCSSCCGCGQGVSYLVLGTDDSKILVFREFGNYRYIGDDSNIFLTTTILFVPGHI